jgi:hypothetical protein
MFPLQLRQEMPFLVLRFDTIRDYAPCRQFMVKARLAF